MVNDHAYAGSGTPGQGHACMHPQPLPQYCQGMGVIDSGSMGRGWGCWCRSFGASIGEQTGAQALASRCALQADGTLVCFGEQCEVPQDLGPIAQPGDERVIATVTSHLEHNKREVRQAA